MLLTFTLAAFPAIVMPAPAAAAPEPVRPASIPLEVRPAGAGGDNTAELVRLTTRDRLQLTASYFPPRKSKDKAPGAVLVHDAGADKATLDGLAEALQKRGFGVLTVDLRGHGESVTEDLDWASMDEDARRSAWAFTPRDVAAAVDQLRERSEIHSANLTLIGVGAGCNLALAHAEDDRDIRAVVLVRPLPESFGMDTLGGLIDLGGLPCLLVAPKSEREGAEAMSTKAHAENDGHEYVEVLSVSAAPDDVLDDKRMTSSLTKWLLAAVKR